MRKQGGFGSTLAAFGLAAAVMLAHWGGGAQAGEPAVTPISGEPVLLMGAYEPADIGYTATEHVVSGEASAYAAAALPKDGRWDATPAGKAGYATRIVVLRPTDASRFNGTVIVEWLNVTGGVDSPAVWLMAHRQMIRAGYAYVGVSAQKMGVEGGQSYMGPDNSLKKTHPGRYGALRHPGDAYAFDIYSQVGRLVRAAGPGGVLGPLKPKAVIAVGESQSALYLTTYVNAVDRLAKAYDGFLIHSRFAGAASLSGSMLATGPDNQAAAVQIRADQRVPVLIFETEGDVVGFEGMLGFHAVRQPDTDRVRTWEVAGASHADNYTIAVSPIDTGKAPLEALAAAYAPTRSLLGQPVPAPINFGPQQHYAVQAALATLERWVRTGKAPPTSPRIELSRATPQKAVLDAHGIARGGIRTPWVDAPTARLSSDGNPGRMAAIFGTSEVFDAATLERLYPGGKADYLKRFEASLDQSIRRGFILPQDRAEILGLAALMYPKD